MDRVVIPVNQPPSFPRIKRVAIYCRVSTQEFDQLRSIPTQIKGLIEEMHKNFPFAKLFDVYVDIGSGRSSDDRRNMQRLIKDCESGYIDVIMTKSVSRFSRNTLEALILTRKLKGMHIPVYFSSEEFLSTEPAGEHTLTIMEAAAQANSESKSKNIKLGIKMSSENPDSAVFNKSCYGYRKDDSGELVIFEPEAENVRLIYDLYLKGLSIKKIKLDLESRSIPSPTGKDSWPVGTIAQILKNEKYIGDSCLYKTIVAPYPNKKRLHNDGIHRKQYVKNHHEPILDKDTFEAAQKMQAERSNFTTDENGNRVRKSTRYVSPK